VENEGASKQCLIVYTRPADGRLADAPRDIGKQHQRRRRVAVMMELSEYAAQDATGLAHLISPPHQAGIGGPRVHDTAAAGDHAVHERRTPW